MCLNKLNVYLCQTDWNWFLLNTADWCRKLPGCPPGFQWGFHQLWAEVFQYLCVFHMTATSWTMSALSHPESAHTTFYYDLKTPQRVSQKWFQSHSCTFSIPISLTALSTMFFTSSSTWWSCSSKRSPSVVFSSITKLTYKDRMRESSITHNMFFFLYHSADICIIVFSFFLNSR